MPTYSYKCTECATAFDIQQAFTDDTLTVCPNCGGKLRKLFTAVGVSFNGSGFYRNDSRAAEKSARGGSRSDSSSGSGTSGSSSDSKSSDSASSGSTSSGSTSSESKSSGAKPATSTSSAPGSSPSKAAG